LNNEERLLSCLLMTETQRILRAMAVMDEFTVADLVLACDARAATVRTVLQRNRADLEELVGTSPTGRPGGRWKRYRLRPDAASRLGGGTYGVSVDTNSDSMTADLLAAEELLLSSPTAPVDASTLASLLRRAVRFREDALGAGESSTPVVKAHQSVVDALITLTEGEVANDPAALVTARRHFESSRETLAHADQRLMGAVEDRFESSPLNKQKPNMGDLLTQMLELVADLVQTTSKQAGTTPKQVHPAFAYGQQTLRPTGESLAAHARARVAYGTSVDTQDVTSFDWNPAVAFVKSGMMVRGMHGKHVRSGSEMSLPRARKWPAEVSNASFGASNQRPAWGAVAPVVGAVAERGDYGLQQ
jgi:hypothetical protein